LQNTLKCDENSILRRHLHFPGEMIREKIQYLSGCSFITSQCSAVLLPCWNQRY